MTSMHVGRGVQDPPPKTLHPKYTELPDFAIQRLANSGGGWYIIIARTRNHNLCVAFTHIAMLHLHRQTQQASWGLDPGLPEWMWLLLGLFTP